MKAQLTIRDLFWLVLVVASMGGCLIEKAQKYIPDQHLREGFQDANKFLAEMDQAAAEAGFRFDYRQGKMALVPLDSKP